MFENPIYGPAIAAILREPRLPELGPGQPNVAARSALANLTPENAFPLLSDRSMALGCISGLWLLHDFLDESHTISQELESPTGSYWHAIMHRREPDAANSKYWWRKVGNHPVFESLNSECGGRWDPFAFVDQCEACRGRKNDEELKCRQLQLREWELLFDWCYQRVLKS